jgi:phosphatidylglycerol lysyltransferase
MILANALRDTITLKDRQSSFRSQECCGGFRAINMSALQRVPVYLTSVPARSLAVVAVALMTLGSGVINLYSVIGHSLPERRLWLREVFPLEFLTLSRFLTLLIGFALVIAAFNIYKRKRRAHRLVLLLSGASILFHLTKGLDYEEALFSLVLVFLLLITRDSFTRKSGTPDWGSVLPRLAIAFGVAIAYGIWGFWLLDPHEFGVNFTIGNAALHTFRILTFAPDPEIVPRTHYAIWFYDSLQLITLTAFSYSVFAIFRPVLYHFRTLPRERELARSIVESYGRCAQDFFKYWPDKSFFFTPSDSTFISYRVGRNFAIALGDPVGPEYEIEEVICSFREECRVNDWGHGFYQVLPDFLPMYARLGYRKLKIGDDAIVDLTQFTLEGKDKKTLRQRAKQLQDRGLRCAYLKPPLEDGILGQARKVSDEWLQIPGRRERGFTLGLFDSDYVRATPLFCVFDKDERLLAFANLVPSFYEAEAAIDLMRHRLDAPNGTMDFLFVKLFEQLRHKQYRRFNLGMAPMAGFHEREEATREERAVHYFFQQLTFIFSFSGLRQYKAKFATSWEPRYAIYESTLDLPRLGLALRTVSEFRN